MAKYKSRATRASEVASQMRKAAEKLRELHAKFESDDEMNEEKKAGIVAEAQTTIDEVEFGEIEALADEMGSWRDGMSGTNLENTDRFSRISDTADTLEGIDTGELQDVEEPDSYDEKADDLENAADELEGCDFPSMYG